MARGSKPKIADGAIICLTVALMGAPEVLGTHITHVLGVWMFWGGLSGLVLYIAWRWGAWLLGLGHSHPEQPAVDNRGGVFIGGDNSGNNTIDGRRD